MKFRKVPPITEVVRELPCGCSAAMLGKDRVIASPCCDEHCAEAVQAARALAAETSIDFEVWVE